MSKRQLLVLYASTSLWHFWVVSMLFTLSFVGGPVGNAMVTDLVPQESLVRGLAVYGATTWLRGIAGCALTGCAAQSFGVAPTLRAGTCLPLLAVDLLAAVGRLTRTGAQSGSPAAQGSLAIAPSPA